MIPNPSSQTTHAAEIEALLEILACVIEGRTAVYFSAPITTGKRFLDWRRESGMALDPAHPAYREEHRREVEEPNRARARLLVREVRRAFPRTVIDPTAVLDCPGWTQDDYRCLWAGVIKRYAHTVLFGEGWQYSQGCVYEFLTARRSGAATLKEDQSPLTLEEGTTMIAAAITEMWQHGLSTSFLDEVVSQLTQSGHGLAETSS